MSEEKQDRYEGETCEGCVRTLAKSTACETCRRSMAIPGDDDHFIPNLACRQTRALERIAQAMTGEGMGDVFDDAAKLKDCFRATYGAWTSINTNITE